MPFREELNTLPKQKIVKNQDGSETVYEKYYLGDMVYDDNLPMMQAKYIADKVLESPKFSWAYDKALDQLHFISRWEHSRLANIVCVYAYLTPKDKTFYDLKFRSKK